MMKTKALLFLLAVLFGTMSTFAQWDPHNPNHYDYDHGCWGTINIEVGETKTLNSQFYIADPSKLSYMIWEEYLSAGFVKVVSDNQTSCIIEGMKSGTGKQLWCLAKYNDQIYRAHYLINITSKGKLNLSASPAGGKVVKGTKVYLTADQPGADIYYEINGWPTTSSTKYTSDGITIDGACTLRAFAKKRGYDNSEQMSWTFTIEDGIEINATNFPDANFRNYLLAQDYGKDGVLTETEINGIEMINVIEKNIGSLKGIEYFIALTSLICNRNPLTSLDVSKNTALSFLWCYDNQLTTLDVSKNTALTSLWCYGNQLTTLDVSKNTALTSLWCDRNQLTTLDVSKNTVLNDIDCYRNQIKGETMDKFISSLPQNTSGKIYIYDNNENDEGNVCTKAQVAAIKAKGWIPRYYNGSEWLEYEGSEDDSEEPDNPVTPDNPTAPVSIALPDIETVNVNSIIQLTPTLEPADAVTELTWASDDETIAKVTSTGKVAGIKAGTAIISVRTSNGLTAECFVIVQDVSGIEDVKTSGNADAPIYTLSGQKVANVKKGIYIKNGHKVVIK